MSEFTKGPWEVEYDEEYGNHTIRMGTAVEDRGSYEPQHVVEYEHGCWPEEDEEDDYPANKQAREAEANAYLMAASPEMYEALKDCENYLCEMSSVDADLLAIVQGAINKAEGKL